MRQDDVLHELDGTCENRTKFGEALERAVESVGEVRQLSLKNQIAILNLDVDTEPEKNNRHILFFFNVILKNFEI